ncbi:MAG: UDP-glucose--hexose-1-phosphate uridylyltransferase [Firmicutes bacterium]|nr:UDP-glucose--hexose-1-phosphate uridylyltransferase [Bacillota bacterium]
MTEKTQVFAAIGQLVRYGLRCGLLPEEERVYARNLLLGELRLDDYTETAAPDPADLSQILRPMVDYAVENGLTRGDSPTARDLFDTRLMNCLTPRPAEVQRVFREKYAVSPQSATDYFYKLCGDCNYIRRDRIARDVKWVTETPYGTLDITINLSKPEKDPKAIAAALSAGSSSYPECALCRENEGYAGRLDAPARQNHRLIPVTVNGSPWFLQYSPYVYYNEHCIVFNSVHTPMKIDGDTFRKLFSFVRRFPHYFVGSNADLPIVGGSILSHDHFQGGRYSFAMEKAPVEQTFSVRGFEDVRAGIVRWPMSVLRLDSPDETRVIALAEKILAAWRQYTDESAVIFAETGGAAHNTITPIARKNGGDYELDLVLRNNLTTPEHPLGLYHPHREFHHIKKENIGLIEVMGLAVLPARLKSELSALQSAVLSGADLCADETLAKHAGWMQEVLARHPEFSAGTAEKILQQEVGHVYCAILEQCGVFARDPAGRLAFERFLDSLN